MSTGDARATATGRWKIVSTASTIIRRNYQYLDKILKFTEGI